MSKYALIYLIGAVKCYFDTIDLTDQSPGNYSISDVREMAGYKEYVSKMESESGNQTSGQN